MKKQLQQCWFEMLKLVGSQIMEVPAAWTKLFSNQDPPDLPNWRQRPHSQHKRIGGGRGHTRNIRELEEAEATLEEAEAEPILANQGG